MSLIKTYDVRCDECGDWIEGAVGLAARGARARAKSYGWVQVRGEDGSMLDLCPTCAPKAIPAGQSLPGGE